MSLLKHTTEFCDSYGLDVPIIMAPMAGACPVSLASAVSNAGGMGACGALLMDDGQIHDWVSQFRDMSNGAFMLNNWIEEPAPARNKRQEEQMRAFLSGFGPDVASDAGDAPLLSFDAQCQAMIAARPTVISSIMGLYDEDIVQQMKQNDIRWFATITSVTEAVAAEKAGADALIVQGHEAGGHRGNFLTPAGESVGLMSLIPAVADAVSIPLIATGGIADKRSIAAAILLGASAVQIGTGLLRSPEAGIAPAWADAIATALPEDTVTTRAYSGKLGRAIKNKYLAKIQNPDAPEPAPYPIQRALTAGMRSKASAENNIDMMQAWAGQSARLARDYKASDIISSLWSEVVAQFD